MNTKNPSQLKPIHLRYISTQKQLMKELHYEDRFINETFKFQNRKDQTQSSEQSKESTLNDKKIEIAKVFQFQFMY